MARRDEYYNKAKQQGYRSRSAYKLQQLDETAGLFAEGKTVLDLGAAPGGWLQVAIERVGSGTVIGVDRQRIDPPDGDERGTRSGDENVEPTFETVRGDITEERTREAIHEVLDGVSETDGEGNGGVDVVLSDMAPNVTGTYDLDHARSVHLARQAFEVGLDALVPEGDLVVKVFDGTDLDDLRNEIDREFEYTMTIHPDASRDSSSELYLAGKNRVTAPVRAEEELNVEIVDQGSEGDGIAKIEGYTLFVPGGETGERYRVRVEDVKPRFGFATPIE
ncbi:23S rRNA (uridine(2552)-2'-O)-methyltransferase [Halobacteriales archaeon QH_6_64_20]|jgi:23S rRNA (uridine2552-2'-O)-methyltransferase|nr:MAG: 23S rRNA (uridine(2552)-2'-O)-methyltransferase [Halobacteriales archaeon QH_6_64_20]